MTTPEELQKLRAEASELRRRNATVERAWQSQTDRAEQLLEKNKQLERDKKELTEKVTDLEEKLAAMTLTKDKLSGMIFKTSKPKDKPGSPEKSDPASHPLGGQIGHTGHGRRKPTRIDEEKVVYLSNCPNCQSPLSRCSSSYKRIVEDIVVPAVTKITKYTIERQRCNHCQKEVRGNPLHTLPGFRLGTNALSLILFLKYHLRLPLEKIRASLREQYGLLLTEGALSHALQLLSQKLTPEYYHIIEEMRVSPLKHADETSWRVNGVMGWCWAFLTPTVVAYTMEETRGRGVPDTMLGENPRGVLVRDDYRSYWHLRMPQQSCWAHLLRNCRDALKQTTVSVEMTQLYQELGTLYGKLATLVATNFNEEKRTKQYAHYLKQITLISKRRYRAKDVKDIQTRIKNQGGQLITALLHDGVPLTNNAAERMMRPVAVIRKISGGSRSNTGAKTTAVNLSITQTIALKKQNFFMRLGELLVAPNQNLSVMVGKN